MLHIDVMDGQFVPNIQIGTETVKAIKKEFNIPLDYHLMIAVFQCQNVSRDGFLRYRGDAVHRKDTVNNPENFPHTYSSFLS